MKRICKTFAVLLVAVIALFSFSITAGATEEKNSQDGLVASITSVKDSYKANEDIELTFKVTNTNDFAVENVSLKAIIPDGLTIKNKADTSVDTVSLASGESLEFTLTVVKESSVIVAPIGDSTEPSTENATVATSVTQTESIQATTTNVNSATSDTVISNNSDNTSIKTGNNISYWLVGLICLVCLAVAILSFKFRKKAVKYLSLVLCICISVSSVAVVGVTNTRAQEITEEKSFTISKNITVDSQNYELKLNVKYDSTNSNSDIYLYASQYKLLKSTEDNHTNVDVYFYAQYARNVSSLELVDTNSGEVVATLLDNGNIKNGDVTAGDNLFSGIVNFDVTKTKTVTLIAQNNISESNSIDIDIVDGFTDEEYEAVEYVSETINDLLNSKKYEVSSYSNKIELILSKLNTLSDLGYVLKDSIKYDEQTKTVYCTDLIGTRRGIEIERREEGVSGMQSSSMTEVKNELREVSSNSENILFKDKTSVEINNGVIIYGLSYNPYLEKNYNKFNEICENVNEQNNINMSVVIGTVGNLKTIMNNKDFVAIESHGGVFKLNGSDTPLFMVTETVNKGHNENYCYDLNQSNIVIKNVGINGGKFKDVYCITSQFFNIYYGNNKLNESIIYLGTCDSFGVDGNLLYNYANAFISCGAIGVVGHVNSVNTTYDSYLLSAFFDELVGGLDIREALYRAEVYYGETDNEFLERYSDEAESLSKSNPASYNELVLSDTNLHDKDSRPYWKNYKQYLKTSIIGRVSEYKGAGISGPALSNVKVTIEKDGEVYRTATTDSTGHYTLNPVEPGTYTVTFTEKDHETITKEVNVSLGQSATANISMRYKGTSMELSGAVYSDVDKLPLSGVAINGYKLDSNEPINLGVTATDGVYSITLDSDIIKIEFSLSGFETKIIDEFLLFDGNVYLEKSDNDNVVFAGGDGTEENPYQVATPKQLDSVRNDLSAYYIQTADIDMSGYDWNPIGIGEKKPFEGKYNGDNYKIKNLNINSNEIDTIGLFGCCSENSVIKNISIENLEILIDKSSTDYVEQSNTGGVNAVSVGGIVGRCNSVISNCSVSGNIKVLNCNYAYVGGIVGLGTVTDSYNYSNIYVLSNRDSWNSNDGTVHCGGIVGHTNTVNGTVLRCTNYGTVNAISGDFLYLGGISGEYGTIDKCINYGNIQGSTKSFNYWSGFAGKCNVGGIVGATSAETLNSINYGNVTGYSEICRSCYTGGIAGFNGYYGSGIIKNCLNIGEQISATEQEEENGIYKNYNGTAGCISGYSISNKNCYTINNTLVNGIVPTDNIGSDDLNGALLSKEEIEELIKNNT